MDLPRRAFLPTKERIFGMKILIIALPGIGDALMFTPALIKLREIYPDAQIDALVMYKGAKDLYERLEEVSNVIYFDFLNSNPLKALFFVLSLRGKYDVSFNIYPSNRKEYNIISFLIGASKRLAVEYLHVDKKELGFLNNLRIKEDEDSHNVEENVKLVELLSGQKIEEIPPLKFPLTDEDIAEAVKFLESAGVGYEDFVVGFHPGGSTLKNHINKRWSPLNFSSLGKKLITEKNAKVLIFGGPEETQLKSKVHAGINSDRAIIVNTPSVSSAAAVIRRCNLFISNDSGLMHIAAALQIPTVAIEGPINVKKSGPWKNKHKIASLNLDCSPCFYYSPKPLTCTRKDEKFKCLRELKPAQVFKTVLDFLEEL